MAARTVAMSFPTASSRLSCSMIIEAVTHPWASEAVRSTSCTVGSVSSIAASA
jgi:hypothetical protein